MSALLWTGLAVVLTALWLLAGHKAGRRNAVTTYEKHRQRYPSLARDGVAFGQSEAQAAYLCSLFFGPLSLFVTLSRSVVENSVPALVEARAAEHRRELARLQQQIEQAHRDLGVRPFGSAA